MKKFIAIGDIHGDTGLVKKLAKKVKKENIDTIIIPGDLTWLNNVQEGLIKPFTKLNKKVLIVPGNHETNETLNLLTEEYSNLKNIHGKGIKENSVGIFGAGYSHNTGPFWSDEKEIAKTLEKGHKKIKDLNKKIMVTHSHHAGSKAEFTGFKGSKAIKKAIEKFKPDLVLNAHIHEAGGIEEQIGKSRIINVSRKPVVFEM